MSEKYNGWTNYATWRVNLEMFDNYQCNLPVSPLELADDLRYGAEQVILESSSGLAQDYALSFLSDVNWLEIAEHVIQYSCEVED